MLIDKGAKSRVRMGVFALAFITFVLIYSALTYIALRPFGPTHSDLASLLDQRQSKVRIGYIGDSVLAGNNLASPILISTLAREVTWARALFPHFEVDVWYDPSDPRLFTGMNAAVNGSTVAMNRASLPMPAMYAPEIMIISAGINSVTTDASERSIESDLDYMVQYYLKAGCRTVILSNVRPVGTSIIPDGSPQLIVRNNVNSWIANYAASKPNVLLWNVAAAYDNGAGRPIAGYTFDEIHPTQLGSQHGGEALVTVLKELIRPVPQRIADDSINLMFNGRMLGTGGVPGPNVAGILADGYTAKMVTGGSASRITADRLPNSATGGSTQRFRITTSGDSSGYEVFGFYAASLTLPGNIWIKARARVSLSAWGGWRSIYFNAGYVDCMGSALATTDRIDANSDVELDLESMPFRLPESPPSFRPYLGIYLNPGAVGTGILEIKEIEIIPVDDPNYLHNRKISK